MESKRYTAMDNMAESFPVRAGVATAIFTLFLFSYSLCEIVAVGFKYVTGLLKYKRSQRGCLFSLNSVMCDTPLPNTDLLKVKMVLPFCSVPFSETFIEDPVC